MQCYNESPIVDDGNKIDKNQADRRRYEAALNQLIWRLAKLDLQRNMPMGPKSFYESFLMHFLIKLSVRIENTILISIQIGSQRSTLDNIKVSYKKFLFSTSMKKLFIKSIRLSCSRVKKHAP